MVIVAKLGGGEEFLAEVHHGSARFFVLLESKAHARVHAHDPDLRRSVANEGEDQPVWRDHFQEFTPEPDFVSVVGAKAGAPGSTRANVHFHVACGKLIAPPPAFREFGIGPRAEYKGPRRGKLAREFEDVPRRGVKFGCGGKVHGKWEIYQATTDEGSARWAMRRSKVPDQPWDMLLRMELKAAISFSVASSGTHRSVTRVPP